MYEPHVSHFSTLSVCESNHKAIWQKEKINKDMTSLPLKKKDYHFKKNVFNVFKTLN